MSVGKVLAGHHINKHISSFVFTFVNFIEFHTCVITTQVNILTR